MGKHKKLLLGLGGLLALGVLLYFNFWRIPLSDFNYKEGKGQQLSPTGEYLLDYGVYYRESGPEFVTEDSDGYFVCTLVSKPEWSADGKTVHWNWKNSKTIYYEKNAKEVQVEWAADDAVVINGHRLRVPHDTYDYRRDFSR